MAEFSVQDAAFTGFRVVREQPKALLAWSALAFLQTVVILGALIGLAGPAMMQLQAAPLHPGQSPEQTLRVLSQLAPVYGLSLPVILIFQAIINAAMNRAVMRPSAYRFGYLRLGIDEVRQVGLQTLLFALFFAVYLAVAFVVTLLAGIVGAGSLPAAIGIGVAGVMLAIAGMVWLAVRFSLASALTFDSGKINVWGSITLTRGRFWPIFGTFALAFALAAVVYLLGYMIILAVMAGFSFGHPLSAFQKPDFSSFAAYLTAPQIVQLLLGSGLAAMVWPITLTPAATLYQQLRTRDGVGAAEAFS